VSSTKRWHKWAFWIVGLILLAASVAQTVTNEHMRNDGQVVFRIQSIPAPVIQTVQLGREEKPVVTFDVSTNKVAKVSNRGKGSISEVRLQITEYALDEKAYGVNSAKIDSFAQLSGYIANLKLLESGKQKTLYDMNKFPGFIHIYPFSDLVSGKIKPLTYYCLRFTFRDDLTQREYVSYRVTSAVKHDPIDFNHPELSGSGGGAGKPLFMNQIPVLLIAHQREIFGTREEEY